jgi:hypothetical protein
MKNSTDHNHLNCHDECINCIDIIARGFSVKKSYSKFILPKLAQHYFPADCLGGSSNLAGTGSILFSDRLFQRRSDLKGTGSTLFSDRLFWRQLKFGGNWLHIIFQRIVLEIWRELAPH